MRLPAAAQPFPLLPAALLCVVALTGCSSTPTRPASNSAETTISAPRPADGQEAEVDAALRQLDRAAQIRQLFVVGVPLDDLGSGDALVAEGVGGVFLAGRSTAPATELAATTARWQPQATGPRLWVAADQEGGSVQTLKGPGFDPLPSAVEQGDLPPEQLSALADGLGAAMHGAGLNLNLAPVADVVPAGTEAGNEPIGYFERQYGSTGAEVTGAVVRIADGLAAHQVTPTLKHFPGLGRVRGNTDTQAGVTDTVTTVDDEQVEAFTGALDRISGDPFVMMSSATYSQIDPANQAAFSRAVVTDLLRDRLAFDGVVVSDDLGNAVAVQEFEPGERAVRFLEAGGTLVLTVDPDVLPEMVDAVVARYDADPGFAATVDAAVRTALTAKAAAGLLG